MSDTNPPAKSVVYDTNASSLMNISQAAMLEIIGMRPVEKRDKKNVESNALANNDDASAEVGTRNSDTHKTTENQETTTETEKWRCNTPAKGETINVAAEDGGKINRNEQKAKEEISAVDVSVKSSKSEKENKTSRCNTPAKDVTSKELKSILQLAKEARLDTNIGHKRKSVEVGKTNERLEQQSEKVSNEEKDEVKNDTEPEPKAKILEFRNKISQKLVVDFDCATCTSVKGSVRKTKEDEDQAASISQRKDTFCWRCHKTDINISCEVCPRSYHIKCVKQNVPANLENWLCPECVITQKEENSATRSEAMKDMSAEHLCGLLKFVLKRMIQCTNTDPFLTPVNESEFPDYKKYIVQPMDLTHLERHVKNNIYGSLQAFEADAKWILHNSIIFNGYQSKLTTAAKTIIKVCKQEMQEIENCSTCYLNANIKQDSWFVEVCPKPHILLWAKLKSFPYWPAKAMATNSQGMVDARFFGAHDKAWVPIKDCFLFSRKDPNSSNAQKSNINECIKELEVHAAKLKEVYGEFNYAPYKTPFDPEIELEQLRIFLPKFKPNVHQNSMEKVKVNSHSKSSSSDSGSSGNSHKRIRSRSRSRHRKSISSDDKDMEGYGTDDDDFESSLNSGRRKQSLTFQNVEKQNGDEIVDIMQTKEDENRNASSEHTNNSVMENVAPVRSNDITERSTQDTTEPPSKRPKRTSTDKTNDQTTKTDSTRPTNISDKINIINIDENVEITFGNTSKTTNGPDTSKETVNCVVKTKNAVQVDVENKELAISPQNKKKVSDKIIRILNKTDEAATSSTENSKELTKTDLMLKEYNESLAQKNKNAQKLSESNKTINKSRGNLLEDTQVDEANINSMIQNKKTAEKDVRKAKKRSVGSAESNSDSSQSKTLKLVNNETRHNIVINETNYSRNSTAEDDINETDPLALVEVKTEPYSDDDMIPEVVPATPTKPNLTVRTFKEAKKTKAIDNLTKVIDAVAVGTVTAEANNPKPQQSKQPQVSAKKSNKARKSFPAPPLAAKTFEIQASIPTVTFSIQSQPQIVNSAPPLIRIGAQSNQINLESIAAAATTTTRIPTIELNESQNYIPLSQNPPTSFIRIGEIPQTTVTVTTTTAAAAAASTSTPHVTIANGTTTNACLSGIMEEFRALKETLPEAAAKAVSDLICKPPPKLKPRPPSVLTPGFEECTPSSAGHVTSKLNSMAYRMSDYFRGLITETLNDLATNYDDNAATITALKAEIEQLKHKHSVEILEIKKNVYSILKDIQKSITEEQKKLVEDTRAACEAETIKRIQEAKSKQWCVQCSKEAQFYCCWNTSYCDYACQQKHWPQHMSKCSQNVTNPVTAARGSQVQPLVLRPAPPPKNSNNKPLLPKNTKVLFNSRGGNITNQLAQIMKSTSASHIRLIESTPGNYEIINDASVKVPGKVATNASTAGKYKSGNIVTVSSPSTSTLIVTSSSSSQNISSGSANIVSTAATRAFDLPTITNVISLANQGV